MLEARAQWGETREIASVDILATGLSITPGAIDGLTASCHGNSHFILLLTWYKMPNQSNFEIHRLYIFLCLLSLFVSLLLCFKEEFIDYRFLCARLHALLSYPAG